MKALLKLAEKADLKAEIEKMFTGKKINATEGRAVLHTALRNLNKADTVKVDGNEEISCVDIDSIELKSFSAPCKNVSGVRTLWLFLEGDMTIEEFLFE